jgi:predicted MPP superfamily phosphohydrolase
VQGWVQGPSYPVYVTRGVGVGSLPVRLGAPPEVVLFELYPV